MPMIDDEQLLALSNLIYREGIQNGDTVGTIISRLDKEIEDNKLNDGENWRRIIRNIKRDERLLSYSVQDYQNDDKTGFRALCFVDRVNDPSDVNIIFKGTVTDYEWDDNFKGAYLSDTELQEKARAYVEGLPKSYGNAMTVSGHSKGGNEAQYVTITSDRIKRCVSFNGQGFSVEFVGKYKSEIEQKRGRIKSISAQNDVINAFFISIAGSRIYIDAKAECGGYHDLHTLLKEDGSLRAVTEQGESPKHVQSTTAWLLGALPTSQKIFLADNLAELRLNMSKLGEPIGKIIGGISDKCNQIGGLASDIHNQIEGLVAFLYNEVVNLGEDAVAWSEDFMEGTMDFIGNTKDRVTEGVKQGGEFVMAAIGGVFGQEKQGKSVFIQVHPQNLRGYANQLRQCSDEQRNQMTAIRKIVKELPDIWKGEAQDEFLVKFRNMEAVYRQLGETLEQYADLADKVANEMQAVDEQMKRQFISISI